MKYINYISLLILFNINYSFGFTFADDKNQTIARTKCPAVTLQILGAGGPEINDGLASSSYLIWINNKAHVLVDAGGDSSLNFEKSGANFNDLQVILLTHLHVDHSAALPIYLKAGYFSDKHPSIYPYLSDNLYQQATTDFLVIPQNINTSNTIWNKTINKELSISAITVNHRGYPGISMAG